MERCAVFELVKTYEFSPIFWSDEREHFKIRVEVFRDLQEQNSYYARLWRLEDYRIQPTFPQENGSPKLSLYDKQFWVVDDLLNWTDSRSESIEECLNKVVARLYDVFGTGFEEPTSARNVI